MTFEEIVKMITTACNKVFFRGTSSENMHNKILECATQIYIEQMRAIEQIKVGGKND